MYRQTGFSALIKCVGLFNSYYLLSCITNLNRHQCLTVEPQFSPHYCNSKSRNQCKLTFVFRQYEQPFILNQKEILKGCHCQNIKSLQWNVECHVCGL